MSVNGAMSPALLPNLQQKLCGVNKGQRPVVKMMI